MRQITVNIDVYAAIWASRRDGEVDEDDILRRVFDLRPLHLSDQNGREGWADGKSGASMPDGMEIFRLYKNKEYRAKATGNRLVMNGVAYNSLNKLSRAVTPSAENAWLHWFFINKAGQKRPIDDLRPKDLTTDKTPSELGL